MAEAGGLDHCHAIVNNDPRVAVGLVINAIAPLPVHGRVFALVREAGATEIDVQRVTLLPGSDLSVRTLVFCANGDVGRIEDQHFVLGAWDVNFFDFMTLEVPTRCRFEIAVERWRTRA